MMNCTAAVQFWQNVGPGASMQSVGANIWATTTNVAPQAAHVNGVACQLKSQ